jgi:hypothetical protein
MVLLLKAALDEKNCDGCAAILVFRKKGQSTESQCKLQLKSLPGQTQRHEWCSPDMRMTQQQTATARLLLRNIF